MYTIKEKHIMTDDSIAKALIEAFNLGWNARDKGIKDLELSKLSEMSGSDYKSHLAEIGE